MSTQENEHYFHAPGDGGLFDNAAACGATAADEPGEVLRLHQPGMAVTCAACRNRLWGDPI